MAQTTGPWFSATCPSLGSRTIQQQNRRHCVSDMQERRLRESDIGSGAGFDLDRVQRLQPWRRDFLDAMLVFLIPLTAMRTVILGTVIPRAVPRPELMRTVILGTVIPRAVPRLRMCQRGSSRSCGSWRRHSWSWRRKVVTASLARLWRA